MPGDASPEQSVKHTPITHTHTRTTQTHTDAFHQTLPINPNPDPPPTPDLAFLHSGSHDDYWRVLWERGNITKEYLENMNIPIKGAPAPWGWLGLGLGLGWLMNLVCACEGGSVQLLSSPTCSHF